MPAKQNLTHKRAQAGLESALTKNRGPLSHIKVLDFTFLQMGSIVAMWLGDLGADVIKIERPDGGDLVRKQILAVTGEQSAPLLGPDSATYMSLNRNKRSVAMDLKHPKAKEIIFRIAKTADVVTSNFRPGVMDSMGFGYEALKAISPRIIYYTGSGYGQDGPYMNKKGQDLLAQAMGGLMSITGDRNGPPSAAGCYIADHVGGIYGCLGVLAALIARSETGRGQRVASSLLDAVIAMQPVETAVYLNTGLDWQRGGPGTGHGPGSATYAAYKTKDGHIVIVGGLSQFCRVLGLPDLAKDPHFDTPQKQWLRQEELHALLEAKFVARPTAEWVKAFEDADMWAGPVNTFRQVFDDPQVRHNNMILETKHPVAGKIRLAGVPVKLSETPAGIRRHPPMLGEHTDEVLREYGYNAATINQLREQKVVA